MDIIFQDPISKHAKDLSGDGHRGPDRFWHCRRVGARLARLLTASVTVLIASAVTCHAQTAPPLVVNALDPSTGITGNGTTDDTTAINNLLSSLSASGGACVFFPAATYKVTNVITRPNITIEGTGATTIFQRAAFTGSSASPIIQTLPGTCKVENVVIRDITIDANANNSGREWLASFGGATTTGGTFTVTYSPHGGTPVTSGPLNYNDPASTTVQTALRAMLGDLTGCTVTSAGSGTGMGGKGYIVQFATAQNGPLTINSSLTGTPQESIVSGPSTYIPADGSFDTYSAIALYSVDKAKVLNCNLINLAQDGIYVSDGGTSGDYQPTNVEIAGNYFCGNGHNRNGISIICGTHGQIHHNQFENVTSSGPEPGAIDYEPNYTYEVVSGWSQDDNVYNNCWISTSASGYASPGNVGPISISNESTQNPRWGTYNISDATGVTLVNNNIRQNNANNGPFAQTCGIDVWFSSCTHCLWQGGSDVAIASTTSGTANFGLNFTACSECKAIGSYFNGHTYDIGACAGSLNMDVEDNSFDISGTASIFAYGGAYCQGGIYRGNSFYHSTSKLAFALDGSASPVSHWQDNTWGPNMYYAGGVPGTQWLSLGTNSTGNLFLPDSTNNSEVLTSTSGSATIAEDEYIPGLTYVKVVGSAMGYTLDLPIAELQFGKELTITNASSQTISLSGNGNSIGGSMTPISMVAGAIHVVKWNGTQWDLVS